MEEESAGEVNPLRILVCACESPGALNFDDVCAEIGLLGVVTAVVGKDAMRFVRRDRMTVPFVRRDRMTVPFIVYSEDDMQHNRYYTRESLPVLLAQWNDVLVIAPINANTCAKVTNGVCDDFVSSLVKAWDYEKPFYFVPEMHPLEWRNPSTLINIAALDDFGGIQIGPDGNSSRMPSAESVTGRILVSLRAQGILTA